MFPPQGPEGLANCSAGCQPTFMGVYFLVLPVRSITTLSSDLVWLESRSSMATMKQVRQTLLSGAMETGEVPLPGVRPCEVLVRTHYSFVSMGTEKVKVTQARMNLAAK